ncbi:MAG: S41 family peptidase [Bdellovibrionota bacterium]
MHLRHTLALILASLVSISTFAMDLACNYVVPIQGRFLQKHINYDSLTANLESRTVDQFVKSIDPSKTYLLQADVDTIKKNMKSIFDKAKAGDCAGIEKSYEILKGRLKEASEYSKKYLDASFKLDPTLKVTLDSDKKPYAKSKAQFEETLRKYMQLQVANYVATGEKLEAAREKVIKNYDRASKRLDEETVQDRLSTYLDAYARSLDPHSSYWSPVAYDDFRVGIGASLEGIGATLSSKDGITVIEQLIPGGPAAKSGLLQPKDKIIAVGSGESGPMDNVLDQDLRNVVSKIRGQKGTKVRLSVLRDEAGGNKKFVVTIVRDKIDIKDERAAIDYIDREVGGKKLKVGLINLPSFYADPTSDISSYRDMQKLMREARNQKVDALVLDLSTNGGGSLQDAVGITGLFFREGNVVKQSSKYRNRGELELADENPMVDWPGPLVVLTSRVSASASEIVAGALKDYRRAVIVGGDHTFGKGTVQAVDDTLPQGLGAIKTTIGMFFTAGGKSTQHIGVTSDIVFPSAFSDDEFGEKTLDYSLPPKTLKPFLSVEAYVPAGPSSWKLLDKKTVDKLRAQSKGRVDKSVDFKKIVADIAKSKKKKNEIIIGEVIKDREESNKETKELEGKDYTQVQAYKKDKYMKRADIIEALNIAADLTILQAGGKITLSQKEAATAAKGVDKVDASQLQSEKKN